MAALARNGRSSEPVKAETQTAPNTVGGGNGKFGTVFTLKP